MNIKLEYNEIDKLRRSSRKLLREWGILKLQHQPDINTPSHAHTLLELNENELSVSDLSVILGLDASTTSRIVDRLSQSNYVQSTTTQDKRCKMLSLTKKGEEQVAHINKHSNQLIVNAFEFLTLEEAKQVMKGVELYSEALSKARESIENIRIRTLKKDMSLRKMIMDLVTDIQKNEFNVPVTSDTNQCIINAEETYYYKGKCNFWYAFDQDNRIIGCVGLKRINATSAELKKCFVVRKFRGKGVAQKLVSTLVNQAEKHGFQHIYLGSVDYFKWAHRFYEKLGFNKIKQNQLPTGFDRCTLDGVFFRGTVGNLKDRVVNK